MDVALLEKRLVQAERSIEREVGEAQATVRQIKDAKEQATKLREEEIFFSEASGVLTSFADIRQAEVHQKIEGLVTEGLQHIFDDDLRFKIVQEMKSRRLETRFFIVSEVNGSELETDVLSSRGGGVAAVVGFLVRLLVVTLQPERRKVLFLDETFGMTSAQFLPRVSSFIRSIVDSLGVQIILVTHQDEFVEDADVVYEFSQENGKTVVKELVSSE